MIPPELEKLLARLEQARADAERLSRESKAAERTLAALVAELCDRWRTLGEGPGLFDRPPEPAAVAGITREEAPAAQAPEGLKPPAGHSGQRQGRTVTLRDWRAWDARTAPALPLGRVLAETRESALTIAIDRYGVPAANLAILEPGAAPQAEAGPAPAREGPEPAAPPPTWDAPCDFLVALADGQTVGCTWDPDDPTRATGTPRCVLTLRGDALGGSGFYRAVVTEQHRTVPLPEFAARVAGEEVRRRAARPAQPPPAPKQPDCAAARQEDPT